MTAQLESGSDFELWFERNYQRAETVTSQASLQHLEHSVSFTA